jgi:hypothetical protein
MNKLLLALVLSLGVMIVSTPAMARRGADDNISGHVHQCRGCDDLPGHVRGGDHADGQVSGRDRVRDVSAGSGRRGRGADDGPGHVRGGHGTDDGPNHQ